MLTLDVAGLNTYPGGISPALEFAAALELPGLTK